MTGATVPTFHSESLLPFIRQLFEASGASPEEAGIVAGSLVLSNLCGHDSHGIIRIPQYLKMVRAGQLRPGAEFAVVRETPGVLVADGNWGFGQVQAHRLLERLLPKARTVGLAAGTLMQSGHVGRVGEYAETAARHGLAFIGTVTGHGFGRNVAPPGGTTGRIGTNPLCMGAPTAGDPIILDIGTSVCAEGKVRVLYNKKQPVPEGWIIDAQGCPTTDASVLYQEPPGSILPLGGQQAYKGFGIGLLLDMFTGGLSGAPCSNVHTPAPLGNAVFFLVLDIDAFAGAGHFLREIDELAKAVRDCPRVPGVSEILLPGDPERKERARRQAEGIPVDNGTWQQLAELAKQLKVKLPG